MSNTCPLSPLRAIVARVVVAPKGYTVPVVDGFRVLRGAVDKDAAASLMSEAIQATAAAVAWNPSGLPTLRSIVQAADASLKKKDDDYRATAAHDVRAVLAIVGQWVEAHAAESGARATADKSDEARATRTAAQITFAYTVGELWRAVAAESARLKDAAAQSKKDEAKKKKDEKDAAAAADADADAADEALRLKGVDFAGRLQAQKTRTRRALKMARTYRDQARQMRAEVETLRAQLQSLQALSAAVQPVQRTRTGRTKKDAAELLAA